MYEAFCLLTVLAKGFPLSKCAVRCPGIPKYQKANVQES